MTTPASRLQLQPDQLEDIRDRLAQEIRAGLTEPGQRVPALLAHLPPPPPDLEGEALVVDTGGTNTRAAVVRLYKDRAPEIVAGPVQQKLPVREAQAPRLDAERFFAFQAELAQKLEPGPNLPVGYCFSYPSEVFPSRDARLLRWTKGIDIPGVEGECVGTALQDALRNGGLTPGPVCVLNDTVASLIGGSRAFRGAPRDVIGLIVGTGTNMAGYYDAAQAPKLAGQTGPMAINLESGNFDPLHRTEADRLVDEASENPGRQRFEKAVSGHYLPYIFAALHPEQTDFVPALGTGPLVQLIDQGPDSEARQTALALLKRSADLVAAGVAGVIQTYPETSHHIGLLAEGGLFWNATGYAHRVEDTLRRLLPNHVQVSLLKMTEANLIGAACAALVD